MNRFGIHHRLGQAGRKTGSTMRILALAFIALGACVINASHPQAFRSNAGSVASPPQPARVLGDELQFVPGPGSRAELQGSTSVGSWTSRSTDIQGQILLSTQADAIEDLFDRIHNVDPTPALDLPLRAAPIAKISVPVDSLHGDSAGMDHDMRQALKAGEHPFIQFDYQRVERATVISDPANHQSELKLRVSGNLTLAGVTRPIAMDAIVRRDSRRHFRAEAQATLMMSDFGVTPPVALFGLIKAGDKVHVVFELALGLGGAEAN